MRIFDESRDKKLIAGSNHFYCRGHLTARPLTEQSSDKRYCRECFQVIQGERRTTGPGDYWTESGLVFVHMGKKYGLLPSCKTVCLEDSKKEDAGPGPDSHSFAVSSVRSCAKATEHGPAVHHPTTPQAVVTDNSPKTCLICGGPVLGKRVDRHYCSAKCRQRASRGGKQASLAGMRG